MKTNQAIVAIAVLSAAVLSGCAAPNQNPPPGQYPASNAPAYYSSYGVIESIQVQQASSNSGIGGAVVGGVVGGVLGNQIGQGSGRTAATAAGVVGGAVVGNQIQKNNQQTRTFYQITVRLDNGNRAAIEQDSVTDLRVGDRVRVENGHVFRY